MLCTLMSLRRALKISLDADEDIDYAASSDDDFVLRQAIHSATGIVETHAHRHFSPVLRSLRLNRSAVRGRVVFTSDDLMEVFSVTNGDETALDAADYGVYPDDGMTVPYGIELYEGYWTLPTAASRIVLAALTGYHEDRENAWPETGDVLPSELNTTTATISLSNVIATDDRGLPRYEPGMWLRLEDEIVSLISITLGTSPAGTLTITRGQQRTTAATHAANAPIQVFRPMTIVENAVSRIALWLYQHRDVSTGGVQFLDTGVVLSDRTISDILRGLDPLQRKAFSVVRR